MGWKMRHVLTAATTTRVAYGSARLQGLIQGQPWSCVPSSLISPTVQTLVPSARSAKSAEKRPNWHNFSFFKFEKHERTVRRLLPPASCERRSWRAPHTTNAHTRHAWSGSHRRETSEPEAVRPESAAKKVRRAKRRDRPGQGMWKENNFDPRHPRTQGTAQARTRRVPWNNHVHITGHWVVEAEPCSNIPGGGRRQAANRSLRETERTDGEIESRESRDEISFSFSQHINMEIGATVTHADCPSADGAGMPPHSWSPVDPSKFMVRQGPNYSKHKRKDRNAGGTFYELRAMDWYKASRKVDGVANQAAAAALPEAKFSHPSVPSLLVVNVQLPTEVSSEQRHGVHAEVAVAPPPCACRSLREGTVSVPSVVECSTPPLVVGTRCVMTPAWLRGSWAEGHGLGKRRPQLCVLLFAGHFLLLPATTG